MANRILLIPGMPEGLALDFIFRSEEGIVVQASEEEIQQLQDRGIPIVELYGSGNAYAAAVFDKTEEQAKAALRSLEQTKLAALSQEDRDKFGVA